MSSVENPNQKDLIKDIEKLNTKLIKISNNHDLEVEELEKEIDKLKLELEWVHHSWNADMVEYQRISQQYEILKLEILGLHQILEKNKIKFLK